MTALVWDKVGDRRYETGIDRGVLFLPDGGAVSWNGLTSVAEDRSREVKSYYIDGIKYLDHFIPGAYTAKLSAFTYPDELDDILGTSEYAPGVFLHDQRARLFSLSYRTLVGNDVEGVEYAYKVHIIYNVMASPSDMTYNTQDAKMDLAPMTWNLTGVPPHVFGIRPTSHISLDSRRMDPDKLAALEAQLYGSESAEPEIPDLVDLLSSVDTS